MDILKLRELSWDRAVDAHGTYEIFARRKRIFSRLTRFRDFLGILVPILVGAAATAEWLDSEHKIVALAGLAIAGTLQLTITVWSLVSRWDEALGYSNRATRDSTSLRDAWEKIAKGQSINPNFDYEVVLARQEIIDAFDTEQGLEDERRYGMRASLYHYQRACGVCYQVPRTRHAAFWTSEPCDNCGQSLKDARPTITSRAGAQENVV